MNAAPPLRTATCVGGGAKMNLKFTKRDKFVRGTQNNFMKQGAFKRRTGLQARSTSAGPEDTLSHRWVCRPPRWGRKA